MFESDDDRLVPSQKTMKAINNVMRDRLGGHVIAQCEHFNGILEFWSVGSKVVIVHAYGGDAGWTHYNQSKENTLEGTIKELS